MWRAQESPRKLLSDSPHCMIWLQRCGQISQRVLLRWGPVGIALSCRSDSQAHTSAFKDRRKNNQGRILAVWILAPKLPNSDLEFSWIFGWIFSSGFSKKKARKKSTKESTAKFTREFVRINSPRISAEAFS